jgi:hypothetical protein
VSITLPTVLFDGITVHTMLSRTDRSHERVVADKSLILSPRWAHKDLGFVTIIFGNLIVQSISFQRTWLIGVFLHHVAVWTLLYLRSSRPRVHGPTNFYQLMRIIWLGSSGLILLCIDPEISTFVLFFISFIFTLQFALFQLIFLVQKMVSFLFDFSREIKNITSSHTKLSWYQVFSIKYQGEKCTK